MRYTGIDVHKGSWRVVSFDPATGEVQDLGSASTQWALLTLAHHLLVHEEDYQPRPVRASGDRARGGLGRERTGEHSPLTRLSEGR